MCLPPLLVTNQVYIWGSIGGNFPQLTSPTRIPLTTSTNGTINPVAVAVGGTVDQVGWITIISCTTTTLFQTVHPPTITSSGQLHL